MLAELGLICVLFGQVYHHSSTLEEGVLNGGGNLLHGLGSYYSGYGDFLIEREIAREQYLKNYERAIHQRWAIKDAYNERFHGETYLDRWEKRLDNAELRYKLSERERELIELGILSPRPEPNMNIRGRSFTSIEEWRASPEYLQLQKEYKVKFVENQLNQITKDRQYKQSLAFLKWWDGRSFAQRENYQMHRAAGNISKPHFELPEYQQKIDLLYERLNEFLKE